MRQPGRIRFATAFAVAASLTILIILGLSSIAILSFHEINATALSTRNDVLPVILERQRTAVNLERLGQFGEIVLNSSDAKQRREKRLDARILSQDAAFETDPAISRTVRETYETILYAAQTRDALDRDQKRLQEDFAAFGDFYDALAQEVEKGPGETRLPATRLLNLIGQTRYLLSKAILDSHISNLIPLRTKLKNVDQEIRPLAAGLQGYPSLEELPAMLAMAENAVWLKETVVRKQGLAANAWKRARDNLNVAAGNLSLDAANITAERFSAIASKSDRGMNVVLFVVGSFVCVILLIGLAVNRQIIRPIIAVTRALERADQTPDLTLPRRPIKELDAIDRAAENLANLMAKYAKRAEELEAAKKLAEQANQIKSEFLATMSHEIRTPLNTIFGISDIAMQMELKPEQKEYCGIIHTATARLKKVVDDILDFSRIDAGKLELEQVDFDLMKVCSSIAELERAKARENNIDLDFTFDPAVPRFLRGDPNRLEQILGNLLDNALKFTKEGGVSLRVSPLPPKQDASYAPGVCFEVADTGIGVPEDKRGAIFESFRQADSSTTREYGGAGLGLAICAKLAALMGGEIRYAPNQDQGSVFSFSVHFQTGHALHTAPDRTQADVDVLFSHPLRLLLVEDNPTNQKVIELFLQDAAVNIDHAKNGEIAVGKALTGAYDLILMDMEMPVMDGYEATRCIRDWEGETGKARTPILALTAHTWKDHRERALSAGCDGFLPKPFSRNDLLRHLADALKGVFHARPETETPDMERIPARPDIPTQPDDWTVTVDADVRDMVPHFFETVRADILSMRESLEKPEYETLRRRGRDLKGAGQSYGFSYLMKMGRFLEQAAKDQKNEDILKALLELEDYLDKVRVT